MINSEQDQAIGIITLSGTLEGDETANELERTADELVKNGVHWIIVNCAELSFIDLPCANGLIAHWVSVQLAGGNIVLCELREELCELVLHHYGYAGGVGEIGIYLSEEAARADFREKTAPTQQGGKLALQVEPAGPIAVVRLQGTLWDQAGIELLKSTVQKEVELECQAVILDLTLLPTISTEGIGALIAALKITGQRLRLCKVWGPLARLLETLGLSMMFKIHNNIEDALAAECSGE